MENALVVFGASLQSTCAGEGEPTISTKNGQILFDADDHTFIRRRRDTVSLFDMADAVKGQGEKLDQTASKTASDRAADIAAQGAGAARLPP